MSKPSVVSIQYGIFHLLCKTELGEILWEVGMGLAGSKPDESASFKLGFLANLWQDSGKNPNEGLFLAVSKPWFAQEGHLTPPEAISWQDGEQWD